MILNLPNTTTREISATLLRAQENYSLATGRVLTLLVVASADDDVESILLSVRDATQEHPARVLVLLLGDDEVATSLDAECIFTADAGASEMVVMHVYGELTQNLDSIVTPLILPDTPIVAWWPTTAPASPLHAPLGNIAQRRITNARRNVSGNALLRLSNGYSAGDSDMMWSRITPWRGIVASAVDRHQGEPISSVTITGPVHNPSVDIAAGWLASCLHVDVVRRAASESTEIIENVPITELRLGYDRGDIVVSVLDEQSVCVAVPGSPDSFVAMTARSDAECLAEELRHLDPDTAYYRALKGLGHVKVL